MATAGPLLMPGVHAHNFSPIINETPEKQDDLIDAEFDPKRHLCFVPPESVITMKDIGYKEDVGVSPLAVSQPFRLFTKEAIMKMRAEIFSAEVMRNCQFKSNIAACQLRGYSAKSAFTDSNLVRALYKPRLIMRRYAPFIHDCWHNEATLAIISKIAGVELIPEMDLEIGHINISVKSEEQTRAEREMIEREKRMHAEDEGIAGCPWEVDAPVVGWHTDSYPFVCVLMLSDCKDMVGGETALRTANGEILKVRGPEMGCAVVLQGRHIVHQALRAIGTAERITMVTSFRPRSPFVRDDTVLTTVRPISNLSELYYEFAEYRLEIIEQRVRAKLKEFRDHRRAGRKFPTEAFKCFLNEQNDFLGRTNAEVVEDEQVVAGHVTELKFPEDKSM